MVRCARAATQADPTLAYAHRVLIEAILDDDTIESRRAAADAAQAWVRALPSDPDGWFALATIRREQGFFEKAMEAYERTIALRPPGPREQAFLAETALARGRTRNDSYRWGEALDRIVPRVHGSSPDIELLASLVQLAVADGRWGLADSLATVALLADRGNAYARAARITARVRLSRYADAQADLDTLSAAAADGSPPPLFSPEPVLSPDELNEYRGMSAAGRRLFASSYWASHDPDPSTPLSERLLEHVARLTVADARFTTPDGETAGRDTDRGRVYVRWGEPDEAEYILGDPPLWIWAYYDPPMQYTFADEVLSGVFGFAFPRRDQTGTSTFTYRARMVTTPEVARHDYGFEPMRLLGELLFFPTDSGRTRAVIALAVPAMELSFAPGKEAVAEARLVLRGSSTDSTGAVDWADTSEIDLAVPPTMTRNPYAVIVEGLSGALRPGRSVIGAAAVDSAGGRIGVLRFDAAVPDFAGDTLALSDFLLATRADTTGLAGPFSFGGVALVPAIARNLSARAYAVYLEAVGLAVDEVGGTDYEVRFVVASSGERETAVSTTFRMHGVSRRERLLVAVDLSTLRPGEYALEVEVRDRVAGRSARARREFVIVGA